MLFSREKERGREREVQYVQSLLLAFCKHTESMTLEYAFMAGMHSFVIQSGISKFTVLPQNQFCPVDLQFQVNLKGKFHRDLCNCTACLGL